MKSFKIKKEERKVQPYQDMGIGENFGIKITTIIKEEGKVKLLVRERPMGKKGERNSERYIRDNNIPRIPISTHKT